MSTAYAFGQAVGAQIKQAAGVAAPKQQPVSAQPPVFDVAHGRKTLQEHFPKQYKPAMTDRQVYDMARQRGTINPGSVVMASRGVKRLAPKVNPFQQAMRTRYNNTLPVFGGDLPPTPPAPAPQPAPHDPNDPTTWGMPTQ